MPAKKSHIRRPKAGRHLPRRAPGEKTFESLVATGVRKFILKDATIREFSKTLRSAAQKNSVHPHPLSSKVLTRIVREAIQKRKEYKN